MADLNFMCVIYNLQKHMIAVEGELSFNSFVESGNTLV